MSSGGTASATSANFGTVIISGGGVASGTVASGFSQIRVSSGGIATNTLLDSSGIMDVYSGGIARSTTLLNHPVIGGELIVHSSGVASNTAIAAGTSCRLAAPSRSSIPVASPTPPASARPASSSISGGTTSNAVVFASGVEIVFSGGTASNTTVSGGTETVSSAGTLTSATIGGGGLVEIKSGGLAGSSTITIASGTLKLDDSQHFSGNISGLTNASQVVDLVDINFATLTLGYSGNTQSGVLSASDGVHTALLNVIGNYTLGNFKSAGDGGTGSFITDPPISQSSPVHPTQSAG